MPRAGSTGSRRPRSTSRAASTRPASTSAPPRPSTRTCSSGRSSATSTPPAPAGNELVPGPRGGPRRDVGGRADLHVHAEGRRQVRPAGQPRDHVGGHRLRVRADRHREPRRPVRLLLHGHRRDGRVHRGRRTREAEQHDLGHRDARRQDDRLHADGSRPATSSYRLAMPAAGPMPEEVAGCFNEGRRVRPLRHLLGPVHVRGLGSARRHRAATRSSRSRVTTRHRFMRFVRNPNYDPATDGTRPNYVDGFDYTINTNPKDIFNKIEAGELEGEVEAPPPDVLRRYSTTEELKDRLQVECGRPHLVHHDEPHAAAVRRHPRPEGDEPRHGQGRAPARLGRPDPRRRSRDHIVPDSMFNGALDDYAPYADGGRRGRREGREGRDEAVEVRLRQDGVCDAPECKGVLFVNRNVPPFTRSWSRPSSSPRRRSASS